MSAQKDRCGLLALDEVGREWQRIAGTQGFFQLSSEGQQSNSPSNIEMASHVVIFLKIVKRWRVRIV